MIIIGVIMLIAGVASYVYGNQMNNSIEKQIESLFSNGTTNPGSIFVTVGIVVAVIGIVLIVVGCIKKYKGNNGMEQVPVRPIKTQKTTCPHCGSELMNGSVVCSKCGMHMDVNNCEEMPELVGINGPLAGMIYKISDSGLIIGRDSISCQVVIPASQAKVSRIHCYVTFNPMSGMFVLNDRNSTHGTYLANGSRVSYTQPAALKSGDRFYLSTPENTFEVR